MKNRNGTDMGGKFPWAIINKEKVELRLGWAIIFLSTLFLVRGRLAMAAEPYSMEAATVHASDALPQTVVNALNPEGLMLFTYANGIKMPICEIFWAKAVSSKARPAALRNAPYRNIEEGSFLGVIHFLAESSEQFREDFHDQKLQPGYYSMRYAVLPDGETGDFAMLNPVNLDQDPERIGSRQELERRGKVAAHGDEAAVLSLAPVDASEKRPVSLRMDDNGTCIVQAKLHARPSESTAQSELSLAIIVVTPLKEGEGS